MPDPKPRPNHARYIETLRQMTPEQRLRKAFELTDFSRDLLRAGLRAKHPELSEDEIRRLAVERIIACHKQNC